MNYHFYWVAKCYNYTFSDSLSITVLSDKYQGCIESSRSDVVIILLDHYLEYKIQIWNTTSTL